MPRHGNRLKILFFSPHIDDIEIGVPFAYLESLRAGYEVVEVVMTDSEFGTHDSAFKGERLRRIRNRELDQANKIFERGTDNPVRVVKMGYRDGYLPFDKGTLQRVMELIREERPDVIFATDPWFAHDFHPDHINTGRLIYFSLKRLGKKDLPQRVFYYMSIRTDRYWRCRWNDFKIVDQGLAQHRTQYSALELKMIMTYCRFILFFHLLRTGAVSESVREQVIEDGVPVPPPPYSFVERHYLSMIKKMTLWGFKRIHENVPSTTYVT